MSSCVNMSVDTLNTLQEKMHTSLGKIMPDFEIEAKAELIAEIIALKQEKDTLILGHNYMEAALYNFVADIKGDSLTLCRKAQEAECEIILFCGVYFMAETAKILNPTRRVLIPSLKAGCSLAASITAADVRALKERYPNIPIVAYINTYAEVKAEVDICCTSGNAARIIDSLASEVVIFIPDEYLARNVARQTGKKIVFPHKHHTLAPDSIISWSGKCEVHELFTPDDIMGVKKQFPTATVLAHPECSPAVVEAADFTGSTAEMINHLQQAGDKPVLLLTECSMADNIIAANPAKDILRLCSVRCPHMNQITLEQTRDALKYERYEVHVAEEVRGKAERSIVRMLELG